MIHTLNVEEIELMIQIVATLTLVNGHEMIGVVDDYRDKDYITILVDGDKYEYVIAPTPRDVNALLEHDYDEEHIVNSIQFNVDHKHAKSVVITNFKQLLRDPLQQIDELLGNIKDVSHTSEVTQALTEVQQLKLTIDKIE